MSADHGVTDRQCSSDMGGRCQTFSRGHRKERRHLRMSVTSSSQDTVAAGALEVSLIKLPKRQRCLKDDLRVLEST